jgi:hypothetical protein
MFLTSGTGIRGSGQFGKGIVRKMDMLRKLSPQAQVVLGGAALYVIFSFFDWQQVCVSGNGFSACGGVSEWNGFGGTITALSAIALLAWEVVRLLGLKIDVGGLSQGLISVALAGLLLILTIITFLSHNAARHWPSYIGLVLSVVIAGAAFTRGKAEGVRVEDFSEVASRVGSKVGSTAGRDSPGAAEPPPATPPPATPSTPPPPSAEEPPGGGDSEPS